MYAKRYELCFAGEKTIKAIQASQQQSSHEAMETDNNNNKSQNHLTNGDKTDSDNSLIDVFRWSRCKKPLPQKLMRSIGIPLPADHIEVNIFSRFDTCLVNFFIKQLMMMCYGFLEWNRCWRRILIGKMYSGHKLVFGLLEKSTHLLVFIFSRPTKKNLSCFAFFLQNFFIFYL